jgi:16S rRNA processing protein RimM
MAPSADELLLVGVVVGTHGLRGDLKVRPLSDDSDSLLAAPQVFLRRGDITRRHLPSRVTLHKGNYLLRLQGLGDINAAQPLVGSEVLMAFADLPELAAEEFYWFELAGMTVTDRVRGDLGTLEEVFTTAAHDVYLVRGPLGEILIPAVEGIVLEIDRDNRRLLVDLPEGLVEEPHAL